MADDIDAQQADSTPDLSTQLSGDPAQASAQLGGLASALAQRMPSPQQSQQYYQMSQQFLQNALNAQARQNSPMRKLSNVLGSVGAAISGIAPNAAGVSSNMPQVAHMLLQNADRHRQAADVDITNQAKMAMQAAQLAQGDPKMIGQIFQAYGKSGSLYNQQKAQEGKQQIAQQRANTYSDAQKVKEKQVMGFLDHLKDQKVHWDNQDTETQRNHNMINERENWRIDSANIIAQNRDRLKQIDQKIAMGKATNDEMMKRRQIQDKLAADIRNYNLGVDKINMHNQLELNRRNAKGHPVYQDENGNVPSYTNIPHMDEPAPLSEDDYTPISPFPESAEAQALLPMPQRPMMAGGQPAAAPGLAPLPPGTFIPTNTQQAQEIPVPGNQQPPPWSPDILAQGGHSPRPRGSVPQGHKPAAGQPHTGTPPETVGARSLFEHLVQTGMSAKDAQKAVIKAFPKMAAYAAK
jgi:hypothetical protein